MHLLLPLHGDSLEHLVNPLIHVSISVHLLSFCFWHLDTSPSLWLLRLNAPFSPWVRSIWISSNSYLILLGNVPLFIRIVGAPSIIRALFLFLLCCWFNFRSANLHLLGNFLILFRGIYVRVKVWTILLILIYLLLWLRVLLIIQLISLTFSWNGVNLEIVSSDHWLLFWASLSFVVWIFLISSLTMVLFLIWVIFNAIWIINLIWFDLHFW